MKYRVMILFAVLASFASQGFADEPVTLRQDLSKGDYLLIEDVKTKLPDVLIQASGRLGKRYSEDLLKVGLHFRTGQTMDLHTDLRMQNLNTSHVVGVHGKDTHVRYHGKWEGDGGNAFPHLLLTEGGHFTLEADANMDLVQQGSFFTRQLWVYGDNTGTLELAEGFIADLTKSEPVPNALGTIRLGGATLITHHTRNMPANTRPDGRGGAYQNGHVVFERVPGSRWIVKTNNQIYPAQVDFTTSGVIETQADLTHIGHRRIALPVGAGGHFTSSGAFRTLREDVTITKTGPAMLSLDGEQAYQKNATLRVEDGLLRLSTDPGIGQRTDEKAGPFLTLHAVKSGKVHLAASELRMQALRLDDESQGWIDRDCTLDASAGVHIAKGAKFHNNGTVKGEIHGRGTLSIDPSTSYAQIDGSLLLTGQLLVTSVSQHDRPLLTLTGPASIGGSLQLHFAAHVDGSLPDLTLIRAEQINGRFDLTSDTETPRQTSDGRFTYELEYHPDRILVTNIQPVK